MRLKYLYTFYLRQIFRSKLYLSTSLTLILLLITRVIMYMNTWFAQENYGDLPAEIIVIIQMVAILYIIYFYQSFSNEIKFGVHQFFTDGYKIIIEKMIALLLVHISMQIILLLFVYGIFTAVYVFVGIEWSTIYVSLFRFLVDYMFSPLLFTVFLGLIIALIFGMNKISIFFIIFIWFFVGVINQEIFSSFFQNVGANDWKSLFSIGPNSIDSVHQSYIGFNINIGLELKLLSWLFLFISILLIVSIKWAMIKREKRIILYFVTFLLSLSIGSGYFSIQQNFKAFNNADHVTETKIYEQMQQVTTNLNYKIKSYNIELAGNKVRTEIKFNRADTNKPSFQLYYAYPIHSILVDDEIVSYTREGDIIQINSSKDTFKEIVFHYELTDTGFTPYSKNRTILLANHAWYPKKRSQHVYEKDSYLGHIQLTDKVLVDERYFFNLKAKNVLFTNLNAKDGIYEGITSGVSMIQGQGKTLNYQNYEVIYPADWPKMSKRIPEVISRLETIFEEIKLIAPVKVDTIPSKLVFSFNGLSSFMNNDHLFYTLNGIMTAINDEETMKEFEKSLITLTVSSKGNRVMFNEWINMSSQMIKEEMEFEIYELGPTLDILDSPFENIVSSIHSEFNLLSFENKKTFLKEWYLLMDDKWTWMDVDMLMKERKKN